MIKVGRRNEGGLWLEAKLTIKTIGIKGCWKIPFISTKFKLGTAKVEIM